MMNGNFSQSYGDFMQLLWDQKTLGCILKAKQCLFVCFVFVKNVFFPSLAPHFPCAKIAIFSLRFLFFNFSPPTCSDVFWQGEAFGHATRVCVVNEGGQLLFKIPFMTAFSVFRFF